MPYRRDIGGLLHVVNSVLACICSMRLTTRSITMTVIAVTLLTNKGMIHQP